MQPWMLFRGAFFVVLTLLTPLGTLAEGTRDAVQAALDEMHVWVGDGEKGQGWRRFLQSEELSQQLALAAEADPAVVQKILGLYSGETSGLDKSRFVRVRETLEAWSAELTTPSPQDLPAMAEAAKGAFTPIPTERIETAKQQLAAAATRLERFLSGGPAEYASGWKDYLKWDVLDAQLSADEGPDLGALEAVRRSFFADHNGLERKVFTSVRDSLWDYMNMVLYSRRPDLRSDYENQIERLARGLAEQVEHPASENAVAIGPALGWLEAGGQAADLVEAVRGQYWRSNLYVRLSDQLIAAGFEDDVDESNSINQVILGTRIHGQAQLTGRLGLKLVPDQDRASFDITLKGQADSTNVGYNGPVTIHSNGVTQIDASKRLHLDSEGFKSDPAQAWCSTNSNITSIAARSPLVRRIAWNRAGRSKSQAERIAAGRAASRVSERMDTESGERLSEANQNFMKRFRAPLLRRGAFPRALRFRTSDRHLFVRMLQVGRYQTAADSTPPEPVGDHDLTVRIHQSLVSNLAESLLGGEILTDERVVELLEEAELEVPEELRVTHESDPWSITFAAAQPVTAKFQNDAVTIRIRGRRFTRGDQEVRSTIEISAKYQLDRSEQSTLVREGEVSVEYVNRPQLNVGQVAMKTFLRKKFEALFEPTMIVPDLTLPGNWEQAGQLRLQQLESGTSWLTVGWIQLDSMRTARRGG